MNLQDRAYAAGIFIVLGICCIGSYVAVSGFLNANPSGISLSLARASETPTLPLAPEIPTETPAPVTDTPIAATLAPLPPTATPRGFKPSPTLRSRGTPSPGFLSQLPTATPTSATRPAPPPTAPPAGCGYPFCPRLGAPDASLAPTGQACPDNYLWGVVYDQKGKGIPAMKIHYTNPEGEDDAITKSPPDPPGRYDINAGGGRWTLQLRGTGNSALSPVYPLEARQRYTGGAICPTRVDFIEQ